jgi:hypothetical protein
VINTVEQVYGAAIPADRQYWTLCGRSAGHGSEYDHLVTSGVIQPEQFYGVEVNEEIHQENSLITSGGHFLLGDLYTVMSEHKERGELRPAVVNFDSVNMPTEAGKYFVKTLRMLTRLDLTPMLYIANVVLSCYNRRYGIDDFIEAAEKVKGFSSAYKKWVPFNQQYYPYNGTGSFSRTKMGTIALLRK